MKIQSVIAVTFLLTVPVHSGNIYHCEIDGVNVFSNTPCGAHSDVLTPQYQQPSPEERDRSAQRNQALESALAQRRHRQAIEHTKSQINQAQNTINQLRGARDQELAQLRAEQRQQLERLHERQSRNRNATDEAEAMIHQSLSTEMQAVNQRFDSEIQLQQENINRLRQDLQQQKASQP